MPTVFVKDYDVEIDFPDDMTDDAIQSVLRRDYPAKAQRGRVGFFGDVPDALSEVPGEIAKAGIRTIQKAGPGAGGALLEYAGHMADKYPTTIVNRPDLEPDSLLGEHAGYFTGPATRTVVPADDTLTKFAKIGGKAAREYWDEAANDPVLKTKVDNFTDIKSVADGIRYGATGVGNLAGSMALIAGTGGMGTGGGSGMAGVAVKEGVKRGLGGRVLKFLKPTRMDASIGWMEGGEIAGSQLEQYEKDGSELSLSRLVMTAVPAALVERGLGVEALAAKLGRMGPEARNFAKKHLIPRILQGMGVAGVGEGGEEFVQTYLENYGGNPSETWTKETLYEALNAGLQGMAGGHIVGGVGGAGARRQYNDVQAQQKAQQGILMNPVDYNSPNAARMIEDRANVARHLEDYIAETDPALAKAWGEHATEAIGANKPIDMSMVTGSGMFDMEDFAGGPSVETPAENSVNATPFELTQDDQERAAYKPFIDKLNGAIDAGQISREDLTGDVRSSMVENYGEDHPIIKAIDDLAIKLNLPPGVKDGMDMVDKALANEFGENSIIAKLSSGTGGGVIKGISDIDRAAQSFEEHFPQEERRSVAGITKRPGMPRTRSDELLQPARTPRLGGEPLAMPGEIARPSYSAKAEDPGAMALEQPGNVTVLRSLYESLAQNNDQEQGITPLLLDSYVREGGVIPANRPDLAMRYPEAMYEAPETLSTGGSALTPPGQENVATARPVKLTERRNQPGNPDVFDAFKAAVENPSTENMEALVAHAKSFSHWELDEKGKKKRNVGFRLFKQALGEVPGVAYPEWKALDVNNATDFWRGIRNAPDVAPIEQNVVDEDFVTEATLDNFEEQRYINLQGIKEELYEDGFSRREAGDITSVLAGEYAGEDTQQSEGEGADRQDGERVQNDRPHKKFEERLAELKALAIAERVPDDLTASHATPEQFEELDDRYRSTTGAYGSGHYLGSDLNYIDEFGKQKGELTGKGYRILQVVLKSNGKKLLNLDNHISVLVRMRINNALKARGTTLEQIIIEAGRNTPEFIRKDQKAGDENIGINVLAALENKFGLDGAADFLHDAGFLGNVYKNDQGGNNYVIYTAEDVKTIQETKNRLKGAEEGTTSPQNDVSETIEEIDEAAPKAETFKRGDYVRVGDTGQEGYISGIRHSDQTFRIKGSKTWHAFPFAYHAEVPAAKEKKPAKTKPLSTVLEDVNAENETDFTEDDKVSFKRESTPDGQRRIAEQRAQQRRGEEALRKLLIDKTGEVVAMSRPGIGDIVFLYGRPGKMNSKGRLVGGQGISHLIEQRDLEGRDGTAIAMKMPEVIANGLVTAIQGEGTKGERIRIEYDNHTALLSLYRFGKEKTWLLSGWENEDGGTGVNPATAYSPASSGISRQVGASERIIALNEHIVNPKGNTKETGKGVILFKKERSRDFVMDQNGEIDFGYISKNIGLEIRRQAGPIRLEKGTDKFGQRHIELKRRAEIEERGYKNAAEFIEDISKNYTAIYEGKGKVLLLVKKAEGNQIAYVELKPDAEGDYYTVNTGLPIARDDFLKNKTPLWEGAQSLHSSLAGTPVRGLSGRSDVRENIAKNQEPVKPVNNEDKPSFRSAADNTKNGPYKAANLEKLLGPIINNVKKNTGVTVKVIQDNYGFPVDFIERAGADFDIKNDKVYGAYDPKTSIIYLVADHAESTSAAEKTLFEELVGHRGLPAFLGEEKTAQLRGWVYSQFRNSPDMQKVINDYGEDPQIAGNEFMIHYVDRPTIMQRLVSYVREALRRMGFKVRYSDADLRTLIGNLMNKVEASMMGGRRTRATSESSPAMREAVLYRKEGDAGQPSIRSTSISRKAGEHIITSYQRSDVMKAHADYNAAKAGDVEAAARLVADIVKPETVAEAKERFGVGVIYVAPHAIEASGHNAIPIALAAYYASETGGTVDTDIVQTNEARHTGAGAMERMVAPALFGGPVVKGGRYALVDDVSTMGSTFGELAHHIQANGGKVVGVLTLTNASRSATLIPKYEFVKEIERRFGHEIRELFGIAPFALTADEAGYLIGFKSVDALRNRAAKAREERIRQLGTEELRENKEVIPPDKTPSFRKEKAPVDPFLDVLASKNPELAKKLQGIFAGIERQNRSKEPLGEPTKEIPDPVDDNVQKTRSWFQRETAAIFRTIASYAPWNMPHNTYLENVLKSPEWYEHPVMKNIVRLFTMDRERLYHTTMLDLSTIDDQSVIEETDRLRKKNLQAYKELLFAIDYGDTRWKRGEASMNRLKDPNISEEARAAVVANQVKKYETYLREKRGVSSEAIRVWKLHRASYDKALDMMTAQLRALVAQMEEGELTEQTKTVLKDLRLALASMQEWRGFYAPRLRERASWAVQAEKTVGDKTERYREHKSKYAAERLADKLREEGWKNVTVTEISKLPESVYQNLKAVDVAKAIKDASAGMKGQAAIAFNDELIEHVSNLIKSRGFRSSMIHRGSPEDMGVVKGYMEDPLERYTTYVNNLAGGLSKAQVAQRAMQQLLGERDEDGMLQGGIDAKNENRVYVTAERYIAEQLRNLDHTDRIVGIAKSVATFKYLGFNPRSAFVNMTALATTVPASMHQYVMGGKGSMTRVLTAVGKAGVDIATVMTGKKLKDKDEQVFIERIVREGYDDPQLTRDAMGKIDKIHKRAWSKAMTASMWMFGKTEQFNRMSTMLAGYRLARAAGKTAEQAHDMALDASNKAHGLYGRATLPAWAQGDNPAAKVGQMLYVYGKFGHNYLQMMYDLIKKNNMSGSGKRGVKAFLWGFASPIVLAGGAVWPLKDLMFGIFNFFLKLFGWKKGDAEKFVYDGIRQHLGKKAELGARHGLTGLAGIDISGSLSIGVGVPRSIWELTGAVGGVYDDAAEAFHYLATEQPMRAFEKALPTGLANPMRAAREATRGVTSGTGRPMFDDETGRPLKLKAGQTALRAAGFRPSEQAVMMERKQEHNALVKGFTDRRDNIYEEARAYFSDPDRDSTGFTRLMKKQSEYNQSIRDADLVGIVPLMKYSSLKDQARRMTKADKRERTRLRRAQ